MGRPAIVGASAPSIDLQARTITVGDETVKEGDSIANDGISFDTNDLTQTALGFSRHDVEAKFVVVGNWRGKLCEQCLEGLEDRPRAGRPARGLSFTVHTIIAPTQAGPAAPPERHDARHRRGHPVFTA